MACLSDAPIFILAAGDTDAGSVAMGVWTTPAQRERRRCHRRDSKSQDKSPDQRSTDFHDYLPYAIIWMAMWM